MTAVANSTFTAAQFNQYVRDNLNETAPAKASAASQFPVSTGPNAITMRSPSVARVDTSQTSASTSYTDLATVGPRISIDTGTIALVFAAVDMANSNDNGVAKFSVAVSGASSVAASDQWMCSIDGITASNFQRHCLMHTFTGLSPGTNTFTVKYAVGSGTGTFRTRELNVFPL
jgi:hypothetical protein